jgi:hypothetical protein
MDSHATACAVRVKGTMDRSWLPRRDQYILDDDYHLSIPVKAMGVAVVVDRRALLVAAGR